jgi:hypothetical protein
MALGPERDVHNSIPIAISMKDSPRRGAGVDSEYYAAKQLIAIAPPPEADISSLSFLLELLP